MCFLGSVLISTGDGTYFPPLRQPAIWLACASCYYTRAFVFVTQLYYSVVIHDDSLNWLAKNQRVTTLPILWEPSRNPMSGTFPPYGTYLQYLLFPVQHTLVIVPIALANPLAPADIQARTADTACILAVCVFFKAYARLNVSIYVLDVRICGVKLL